MGWEIVKNPISLMPVQNVLMFGIVMLIVIMLSVVAPYPEKWVPQFICSLNKAMME
jgi:hypothetical protein